MSTSGRPYVLVGTPDARRVRLFTQALARLGHPSPTCLTYEQAQHAQSWQGVLTPRTVVRVESPGEDLSTRSAWIGRPIERGEIARPRAQFEGFAQSLQRIQAHIDASPHAWVMNRAPGILQMFDKAHTKRAFARAGVPSPGFLGIVQGYDDLRQKMREHGTPRAFVKLSWSSSASGVVAYKTSGRHEMATTSTFMREGAGGTRLFNSLRLQRYERPDEVRKLLDTLGAYGAVAEVWEPKARLGGHNFDLRVVVIAGHAHHVVGRVGPSPMTNLHLGNARADLDAIRELVGAQRWASAMALAQRCASCFEGMTYSGADIMFARGSLEPMAIEINAFGDLLPNVRDPQGHDTYGAQIVAVERALGCRIDA